MSAHEVERLRAGLAADAAEARPRPDCPAPEEIWAAAAGEVDGQRLATLTDHVAGCPACVEAWRLALEIGRDQPARPSFARRLAPYAALAAGLLLILSLQLTRPDSPGANGAGAPSSVTREGGAQGPSLAHRTLPREAFELRWSGPPGARYRLRLLDGRGDLILDQRDLLERRYLVPAEQLEAQADGAELTVLLSLRTPQGEHTEHSFAVRLASSEG